MAVWHEIFCNKPVHLRTGILHDPYYTQANIIHPTLACVTSALPPFQHFRSKLLSPMEVPQRPCEPIPHGLVPDGWMGHEMDVLKFTSFDPPNFDRVNHHWNTDHYVTSEEDELELVDSEGEHLGHTRHAISGGKSSLYLVMSGESANFQPHLVFHVAGDMLRSTTVSCLTLDASLRMCHVSNFDLLSRAEAIPSNTCDR